MYSCSAFTLLVGQLSKDIHLHKILLHKMYSCSAFTLLVGQLSKDIHSVRKPAAISSFSCIYCLTRILFKAAFTLTQVLVLGYSYE